MVIVFPARKVLIFPAYFNIYNDSIMYDKFDYAKVEYNVWVPADSKANLCVDCEECEEKCPQDIPISDWMEKIHPLYSPE